jgi:polyisoprenoid-binding protein YceI
LFSALLLAAALAPAAHAATLVADKSELAFGFKQMGVPLEAASRSSTPSWTSTPSLRPARSRSPWILAACPGDPSYDKELAGAPWFDTKRNGKASFVSTAIKAWPGRTTWPAS